MTPERAAYHLVMLRERLGENYNRELNAALEGENPLSLLTLERVCYMSDLNGTSLPYGISCSAAQRMGAGV